MAPLPLLLLTLISPSATSCNVPLSTSVDPSSDKSILSLDWVLCSGIPAPRSVASGSLTLPYSSSAHQSFDAPLAPSGHDRLWPIINPIALRSATAPAARHMSFSTGACTDHAVDASLVELYVCRDFECAADMSKAVLNLVLGGGDYKQISTESLSHVAAALNMSVPGVHILTAIYGSKISYNPLHHILSALDIVYEEEDSLGQLRRRLKSYILRLRRGKDNERTEQQKYDVAALHKEQLNFLRQSWP
ncbi:hypothetical protein B0H13DRAFT_1908153 [Mycena leptocephala]|nr:hypothetical protein B0H13DRAFT_1908153 [Mycena leptocephala]